MKQYDLVIVGGGSAGMAAAIEAFNRGIKSLLLIEKDEYLGGILNQCIHVGFGLEEFKEELTGPEYLFRFKKQIDELHIPYLTSTTVTEINADKTLTYTSKEFGQERISFKTIIMATGCYERQGGQIRLSGPRLTGVITAGQAQKYLNIHGYLVGKNVVILGSGDIGLIMARRLTLEGCHVQCVLELMPYSNGLKRNIAQCLEDFDIPLYLSTSVKEVIGSKRVEKIVAMKVDNNLNFIPGTEKEIECDALILSIGLIPYNRLLSSLNLLNDKRKAPSVNQYMETDIPGFFDCGNSLHVHDIVDLVSQEARLAAKGAKYHLDNLIKREKVINVLSLNGISYVVPQKITLPVIDDVTFKFRVKRPINNVNVVIKSGDKTLFTTFKLALVPAEMVFINVKKELLKDINSDISLSLEER